MKPDNALKIHSLNGSIEESFYQLGVKDKLNAKDNFNAISSQLSFGFTPLDKIKDIILKNTFPSITQKSELFKKQLKAYCEGMSITIDEYILYLSIPEILSSFSKWIPNTQNLLFGCSSLFMKDSETHKLIHGRILDFPLFGSYDKHLRNLIYDFKELNSVFSFSSAGFPFPSITSMNKNGISLAIHQNFSDKFFSKGYSIFDIAQTILFEATSLKDVKKILKKMPSLTLWSFFMIIEEKIYKIEISGKESNILEFELKDNETYKHFNNTTSFVNEDKLPTGISQYCQMRKSSIETKVRNHKKEINELEVLKIISSPLKSNQTEMSHITTHSLNSCTMSPSLQSISYVSTPAPKIYRGEIITLKDVWGNLEIKQVNSKKAVNEKIYSWMKHIAWSQTYIDQNDKNKAFHHIQMALLSLENHPQKDIYQFFFLAMQFKELKNNNDRKKLLDQFKINNQNLNGYLKDLSTLYIFRLQKLIGIKIEITSKNITTKYLKDLFSFEYKLRPFMINFLSSSHQIRLDIWDIIYPYFKY